MFHVELREGPESARAFNLSDARLEAILVPWRRGEVVMLGEKHFEPAESELTVYEGRELRQDEIAMGRGWSAALKTGADVTADVLAGRTGGTGDGSPPAVVKFKEDVLAQCGYGRIGLHQVVWLAGDRYPESRISDRLALAERAVWELLHEERLRMLGGSGEVQPSGWEAALLSWDSWAGGRAPTVQLEAR